MAEKLEIKYRLEGKALPPRPVRVSLPGWGGSPEMKKENGSSPQPWHCPPHTEGATHGMELVYQYDTEVKIVNDGGKVQIYRDREQEPDGSPGPTSCCRCRARRRTTCSAPSSTSRRPPAT